MKKINFLFVVLILVFSCLEDETPNKLTGEILGVWSANTVDYSGVSITTVSGQSIKSDFVGEGYDIDFTLTFDESPKTAISSGSYSVHLTTTVLGQTTTQDLENIKFLEDGTWEQTGSQLLVDNNGQVQEFVIEKLTDSELVLTSDVEETVTEQGYSVTATGTTKITFSKI